MCLTINIHLHPSGIDSPMFAERDIPVYKALANGGATHDKLLSPARGIPYELGRKYTAQPECVPGTITQIGKGLHAYTHFKRYGWGWVSNIHMYEAIIPKGSVYYVGMQNDVVSDTLIVLRRSRWYTRLAREVLDFFRRLC